MVDVENLTPSEWVWLLLFVALLSLDVAPARACGDLPPPDPVISQINAPAV